MPNTTNADELENAEDGNPRRFRSMREVRKRQGRERRESGRRTLKLRIRFRM